MRAVVWTSAVTPRGAVALVIAATSCGAPGATGSAKLDAKAITDRRLNREAFVVT